MASARVLVLQVREWVQIWWKVLLRASPGLNSPAKGLKRMVTKVHWLCWKEHDDWVASFRIWSRRICHQFYGQAQTCGNQSNVWKFTKAIARHTEIRDQNLSLGYNCPGEPHQRSPNASKLEDRSQEETEWQEQGAGEAAWRLAKSVVKLEEQERATFFSPWENRCLSASNLKPEEREFVVDSGTSMHMISKKYLSSAEIDTLTKSYSSTIVITTANREVQTHEEATDYVKELDIFLTASPRGYASSLIARKALRWKRIFLRMDQRSKTELFETGFGYNATRRTSFLSWFQACQRVRLPVFPVQHQGHL